jgi:hypothetical protein
MIFSKKNVGVTPINVCEFRRNRRIFTAVILGTNRRTDRQTEIINTFQLSLDII